MLAEDADANFALHVTWALQALPGAQVLDTPDLVVADSGLPCDTFNVICRARLPRARAEARVASAIAHFARAGRPFSWWSGPADQPADLAGFLTAAGLRHAETEWTMSADLGKATLASPAGRLTIRRAHSESELRDFAGIIADGSPSAPDVLHFYEAAAPALLAADSPQRFYLGSLDGEPVSSAEVTVAGGVAGIYGIATRERFRKRGYGTAMMTHVMWEARAAHASTAILQATAAGAGIYTRLGFAAYGEVREFKPRSGHAGE